MVRRKNPFLGILDKDLPIRIKAHKEKPCEGDRTSGLQKINVEGYLRMQRSKSIERVEKETMSKRMVVCFHLQDTNIIPNVKHQWIRTGETGPREYSHLCRAGLE